MKSTKLLNATLLLSIGLFFTQCSADSSESGAAPAMYLEEYSETEGLEQMDLLKEEVSEILPANQSSNTASVLQEQKLIKEGSLSFEADSIHRAEQIIRTTIKKYNGYVSDEWSESYHYRDEIHLTLRIPAKNFEQVITDLSNGIGPYANKNITAKDVSEEYIDLTARIQTKKDTEQRYRELLQKANSVADILEIEDHITELRSDIESLEGRLRYLSDQVAMSTLSVEVYRTKLYDPQSDRNQFADGLENGWDGLVQFFVILTNGWPLLLFGIALWWTLNRMIKRRTRKN